MEAGRHEHQSCEGRLQPALDTAQGPVELIPPQPQALGKSLTFLPQDLHLVFFLDDTIRSRSLFREPALYTTVNAADSSAEISEIKGLQEQPPMPAESM